MISLIGLGNTGSSLVKMLEKFEQYEVITIDSGKEVKEYSSPEEYEQNCPTFKKLFKNLGQEIYLFVSASGNISGATLRILEQLQGKDINVVCICSDPVTLSSVGNLQQNLVSGVLQEYARSGAISNLYLINNKNVEEMIPDVSLDEYWDKINEVIAYLFHTNMCFKKLTPNFSFGEDFKKPSSISKIKTFGIMSKEYNKKLYDLKHITDERYFFSFNKKNEKIVLKNVKDMLSSKEIKMGISLYKNEQDEENIYFESSTHIIQSEK